MSIKTLKFGNGQEIKFRTKIKNNRVILNMTSFEFGLLYGLLIKNTKDTDNLKKIAPRLALKLDIIFTKAYIGSHLDKQAKRDLVKYYKLLKKLK